MRGEGWGRGGWGWGGGGGGWIFDIVVPCAQVHKLSKAIFWLFFVVQKFKNVKNVFGIFFDLIDHIWACAEI